MNKFLSPSTQHYFRQLEDIYKLIEKYKTLRNDLYFQSFEKMDTRTFIIRALEKLNRPTY